MKKKIMNAVRRIVQSISFGAVYLFQSIFFQYSEAEEEEEEIYVQAVPPGKEVRYYNAGTFFWGIESLERLPKSMAKKYGKALRRNHCFPAGKAISFMTDAPYIQIKVIYKFRPFLPHMSVNATCGLDIYQKIRDEWKWIDTLAPSNGIQMSMERTVKIGDGDKRIVIYLPPFAQIGAVYLGFPRGTSVRRMERTKAPIAFYGSSITQGCAASRAGLSYCNIIARYLDKPILNFGFSESAKGQSKIIEYISHTGADIFVMEYDHNATVEELKNTHLKGYQIIRSNNKEAWIFFMSRFSGGYSISEQEEEERIGIIQNTLDYADNEHDRHVIFLNGKGIFKNKELCFVDDRHPNDVGMMQIARELIQRIESFCYEE